MEAEPFDLIDMVYQWGNVPDEVRGVLYDCMDENWWVMGESFRVSGEEASLDYRMWKFALEVSLDLVERGIDPLELFGVWSDEYGPIFRLDDPYYPIFVVWPLTYGVECWEMYELAYDLVEREKLV